MIDYLVYLVVRVLMCVVQALPMSTCQSASRLLARVAADWIRLRGETVDDNLRHAFPELGPAERRRIARRMWEHLFLMAVEMAHAPRKIHWTNWRDYITLVRKDLLVEMLISDRPTMLVCGHFGNFELSGYVLAQLGFPSSSVARPLDNRYLNRWLISWRGSHGQFIIPKNGSASQIDDLLAGGGVLTLLADQHAGDKGCWVNFFNRPASTHKAVALLALSNETPMAVCFCQRSGGPLKYRLGADRTLDPRELPPEVASVPGLTTWYTSELEAIIRRAPEQYWWVHRRWKGSPPAKKNRKAAA
ncbi:MAG TPA: lipid A biosynthesis acyltransferase [Pirellulales bacterium]|nr:lipid A biosynthesis acyltransferase [Pirellulales bacterium]